MPINYSDAPEQRSGELIPDGSFVKLIMFIKAGGTSAPPSGDAHQDQADTGLFTPSKSSDALGLDSEFTVVQGPHKGRKLFQWMTVAGGALDDKGQSKGWNMTKQLHRAMIDSALGLDPKDHSMEANAARMLPSFSALSNIEFFAKIGVEPGGAVIDRATGQPTGRYYDDKNTIERVVVPGDSEYADLRAGKDVPPKPKHAAHPPGVGPASVQASPKPAWGGGAAAPGQAGGISAPAPNGAAAPATTAPPPAAAGNRPAWLNK